MQKSNEPVKDQTTDKKSTVQKNPDQEQTDNSRDLSGLDKNSYNNDGAPVTPGNKHEMKGVTGSQQPGGQTKQPSGEAQQPAGATHKDSSNKGPVDKDKNADKDKKKNDDNMKENMGSGRRQDDN